MRHLFQATTRRRVTLKALLGLVALAATAVAAVAPGVALAWPWINGL